MSQEQSTTNASAATTAQPLFKIHRTQISFNTSVSRVEITRQLKEWKESGWEVSNMHGDEDSIFFRMIYKERI